MHAMRRQSCNQRLTLPAPAAPRCPSSLAESRHVRPWAGRGLWEGCDLPCPHALSQCQPPCKCCSLGRDQRRLQPRPTAEVSRPWALWGPASPCKEDPRLGTKEHSGGVPEPDTPPAAGCPGGSQICVWGWCPLQTRGRWAPPTLSASPQPRAWAGEARVACRAATPSSQGPMPYHGPHAGCTHPAPAFYGCGPSGPEGAYLSDGEIPKNGASTCLRPASVPMGL